MDDKVNLAAALEAFDDAYGPRIVGHLNDYSGRLTIQLRDREIHLSAGEMFIVPRGVEHCPRADDEAHVLLIEPRGTPNTGDAGGPLTAPERER